MSSAHHRLLTALLAMIALAGAARVDAAVVYEPNNSAVHPAALTSGVTIIHDSLNGGLGRPDTLLAQYDPLYTTIKAIDDNSSDQGNGLASELVQVPLERNGSAYFRVTGAGDTGFTGAHQQTGMFSVQFDLYDSNHVFFKTLDIKYDSAIPGFVDNIWVSPAPKSAPEPQRVGGFVTARVQNLVGPGSGDSLDFYLFSGLAPNQPFTATLSSTTFAARLGWFDVDTEELMDSSALITPLVTGIADGSGRALLGITGAMDSGFAGAHDEMGEYTLVVTPEPGSGLMLALGAMLAGFVCWRRRRRPAV